MTLKNKYFLHFRILLTAGFCWKRKRLAHDSSIINKKDYKRQTDNDRKRAERKQQEYNDIDWEDLCHRTSYHLLEPELYTNHHNIAFKGKKDEKVRVVKAHIGSKI